jgi:sugar-specific transcriptional regulator TrmB
MTTENTTTESIVSTPADIAEEFVKANTTSAIIEEFVNHHNTIESLQRKLQNSEQEVRNQRSRWASMAETIEEFLKEHISEGNSASVTDLKELAAELDIELTKEVEVTFTVEVTATVTVPIDFNAEDIEESDFDIRVNYEGSHNDVECDDIEWNTNDFQSDDK